MSLSGYIRQWRQPVDNPLGGTGSQEVVGSSPIASTQASWQIGIAAVAIAPDASSVKANAFSLGPLPAKSEGVYSDNRGTVLQGLPRYRLLLRPVAEVAYEPSRSQFDDGLGRLRDYVDR